MKHPSQELELQIGVAQTVTMSQEKHLSIDFRGQGLSVQDDATFLFQIAISPDVMVLPVKWSPPHPCRSAPKLFKESRVALGHHILVLIPEVKHVAQEVNGCSLFLDAVKKSHPTDAPAYAGGQWRVNPDGHQQENILLFHIYQSKPGSARASSNIIDWSRAGSNSKLTVVAIDTFYALHLGAHIF